MVVAGSYHLAQVNIALPQAPLRIPSDRRASSNDWSPSTRSPTTAPGFVWRLQTEDGDATGIRAFGDDRLNRHMSVWRSLEALRQFVYRSGHADNAATAQGMVRVDAATHQRVVVESRRAPRRPSRKPRSASSTCGDTVPRRSCSSNRFGTGG